MHTPGPWNIHDWNPAHPIQIAVFDEGTADVICEMADTTEAEANARLIAAAPDMLEALKYVRRFVRSVDVDTGFLDKVIAKAEGQP